ncbi:hypothetical protein JOD82_001982 [Paenibacillus sp. 1182]|nr:hypothetical protein [Paenibacillus sp. 1182]MBP1308962.1 hypothetical protein [Paenibacillus sp. 1182]
MLVYNGETVAITVVAEGNPFTVIQPGEWYAKREHSHSGADIEIYNAAK